MIQLSLLVKCQMDEQSAKHTDSIRRATQYHEYGVNTDTNWPQKRSTVCELMNRPTCTLLRSCYGEVKANQPV